MVGRSSRELRSRSSFGSGGRAFGPGGRPRRLARRLAGALALDQPVVAAERRCRPGLDRAARPVHPQRRDLGWSPRPTPPAGRRRRRSCRRRGRGATGSGRRGGRPRPGPRCRCARGGRRARARARAGPGRPRSRAAPAGRSSCRSPRRRRRRRRGRRRPRRGRPARPRTPRRLAGQLGEADDAARTGPEVAEELVAHGERERVAGARLRLEDLDRAVDHEEVEPAVVVVVDPAGAEGGEGQAGGGEAGLGGAVLVEAAALGRVEGVRLLRGGGRRSGPRRRRCRSRRRRRPSPPPGDRRR
jgi:hypothetical protein